MTVLTRWEPFREFSTMQDRMNRMNRLFRESYSPEGPEEALTTTSFAPPVDIYEDEHNIILKLEVPGIDEKDIDVRIEGNTLSVHGERKIEMKRKRRTSVASSGSMAASRGRSRCPARWIRDTSAPTMTRAC